MGQREKAQQIINERYNFQRSAAGSPSDIFAMSDRVVDGIKSRRGSFKKKGSRTTASGEEVTYQLFGPGGLVSIATIVLSVRPMENGARVGLQVADFLFQKGSLGMKPSINGSGQLEKLVAALKAELDLMARSQ